ncbi:MAG: hypothetical protein BWY75_01856 [bacterium ADurb.Bin425]|nr:MAG: hypothetical protein BWY75_01856 [bacterium ADurb.Bin425]
MPGGTNGTDTRGQMSHLVIFVTNHYFFEIAGAFKDIKLDVLDLAVQNIDCYSRVPFYSCHFRYNNRAFLYFCHFSPIGITAPNAVRRPSTSSIS